MDTQMFITAFTTARP